MAHKNWCRAVITMRMLYYDCFAGISGDMNLGAMVDLGVDSCELTDMLNTLDLKDDYSLTFTASSCQGISGTRAHVKCATSHHHRSFHGICDIIDDSALAASVKKRSKAIFLTLAEAEAHVHSASIDSIHFHEVGAVDAIIDIVGAAACHNMLGIDTVISTPLELGKGFITCAHGTFPVPAPATMEILKGLKVKTGNVSHEATTPTGAAIIATCADTVSDNLALCADRIGYGIGSREVEIPNVLRVALCREDGNHLKHVIVLECTIDDMNPEFFGYVSDKLFENGALDVYLAPVYMKKGRPGTLLTTVCEEKDSALLSDIMFIETTTIGIRRKRMEKYYLPRAFEDVVTCHGTIKVKYAYSKNNIINAKPEYDECVAAARAHGVSLSKVYNEALRVFGEGHV